jgi:SAM-dependent methyltransferase
MEHKKEWFSEWFNSPYYHILYQNRDEKEAEFFLRNVVQKLDFAAHHRIVDLACGKGRHAIFLNSLGFDVTGVDLASQSIQNAKQFSNDRLHFDVQDLRSLSVKNNFDIALNLFTSFGYFSSLEEDELVVKNIHSILKPKGVLLIDFMNAECVIKNLVERESKTVSSIKKLRWLMMLTVLNLPRKFKHFIFIILKKYYRNNTLLLPIHSETMRSMHLRKVFLID